MNQTYYEQIDKMEKQGVHRDYIVGWATGYLRNPKIEEQRITEAYEAGFNDGLAGRTDGYQGWAGR